MTSRSKSFRPQLESLEDRTAPHAGALDPSFGVGGLVTTRYPDSTLVPSSNVASAVQVDGKIVVVGMSSNRSGFTVSPSQDFAVARYNLDGTLDTSFSTDGWNLVDFGSSIDSAYAVALQDDGKIVVVGATFPNADDPEDINFAVARFNADGSLDETFGSAGKQVIDLGAYQGIAVFEASANAVAVQADGKIVVGGFLFKMGLGFAFAAVRLNADGSLDNSFDGDGKQILDFGTYWDQCTGMALQPDGKILLSGTTSRADTGIDIAVVRLSGDGTLDESFGDGGKQFFDFGFLNNSASSVALQPDGKIVVAGDTGGDFAVTRLNPDGSLDDSFDGDGWQTIDVGSTDDLVAGVAVQQDGKIVVAGNRYWEEDSIYDFAVTRLNPDGSLDDSFGEDGRQTIDFGTEGDFCNGLALQPDGKIVVIGYSTPFSYDFALARLDADGSLDETFDGDGLVLTDMPRLPKPGELKHVAVQADGKMVVIGEREGFFADREPLVGRYNADGSLDTTFGTGGFVKPPFNILHMHFKLAVQQDGKILLAMGATVARLNVDGSLDTTFGNDGMVVLDKGSVGGMALTPDGKIVVAGETPEDATGTHMAVARLNQDGRLDTTFDGDGWQIFDFGEQYWEGAIDVAIGPNGEIILIGQESPGLGGSVIPVARLKKDGRLDRSFDGDGKQTIVVPTDGLLSAIGVAVQPDGKVVVLASEQLPPTYYLTRLNKDGSLDKSFDGDGQLASPDGFAFSMALTPNGKIVVAGKPAFGRDFFVGRLNNDGSQDNSFDGDGRQLIDFGDAAIAYDVAVQRDGKIVAVGSAYNPQTGASEFALARLLGNGNKNVRTISINDVEKREGHSGTTAFEFTVSLSKRSRQTVTVNYETDTTRSISDIGYQLVSGTLTFAPGETTKTVTVLVHGDRIVEENEPFRVTLFTATNAAIADMEGIGTIVDDEPRLSINDVTQTEGSNGQTTLFAFTVTLSDAHDEPVTVSYRAIDGPEPGPGGPGGAGGQAATGGEDFVAAIGTLTFDPGETTKTITIEVKGDSKKEADEIFFLELFGNSSNVLLAKNRGLGTILNDD